MTPSEVLAFVDKNEQAVTDWRKALADKGRKKGELPTSERLAMQRSLLLAAHNSSAALARYMRSSLRIEGQDLSGFPKLEVPISTGELHRRLPETAIELHGVLEENGFRRRHASTGSFWLYCTIHWLENDLLPDPPASEVIHNRVQTEYLEDGFEPDADQARHIDDRTRDFLRRTGGIPHVRDRVAYMSDCPAAHMWWAVELSKSIASVPNTGLDEEETLKYLLTVKIMEELIRWVSRFAGRLAQPLALAGALQAALNQEDGNKASSSELREMIERLVRRGRRWRLDNNSPLTTQELTKICSN